MSKVEILDEKSRHFSEVSDYKETFDVADYTKRLFGMFTGQKERIDLICDLSVLEQIVDTFGENIFIRNVTDKKFSITVSAVVSEAFLTFLMNYGNKIEVEGPQFVREKLINKISEIKEIYGC